MCYAERYLFHLLLNLSLASLISYTLPLLLEETGKIHFLYMCEILSSIEPFVIVPQPTLFQPEESRVTWPVLVWDSLHIFGHPHCLLLPFSSPNLTKRDQK